MLNGRQKRYWVATIKPKINKVLKEIKYNNLGQIAIDALTVVNYSMIVVEKLYAQKKINKRSRNKLIAKSMEYIAERCSDMITDTNYFIDVIIRFFIRKKLRKALKVLWSEDK